MRLVFYVRWPVIVYNMFVLLAFDLMLNHFGLHHLHGGQVQQDGERATPEEEEPLEPTTRSPSKDVQMEWKLSFEMGSACPVQWHGVPVDVHAGYNYG